MGVPDLRKIEIIFKKFEKEDDEVFKNFIRDFVKETYENLSGTIRDIEQAFCCNSIDHKILTNRAESIRNLLKKYEKIFIAVGITEEEINEEKKLLTKLPFIDKKRIIKK